MAVPGPRVSEGEDEVGGGEVFRDGRRLRSTNECHSTAPQTGNGARQLGGVGVEDEPHDHSPRTERW